MKKAKLLPVVLLSVVSLVGCGNNEKTFKAKDYGYLLDTFVGVDSTLEVGVKKTVITDSEGEKLTLKPKSIQKEEISYLVDDDVVSEEVPVVYFNKANGVEYRLTFTPSYVKRIVLEAKRDDKYYPDSYYVPEANYFAGAYNGFGPEYSSYNYVYMIDNGFDEDPISDVVPGYGISVYFNNMYADTSTLFVPGFLFVEDQCLTVGDFFDTTDNEYYGYTLLTSESGDLLELVGEDVFVSWFADASFFLSEVYDEFGVSHNNSYSFEYDENYEVTKTLAEVDGKSCVVTSARDENGQYFILTYGEGENDYFEARSSRSIHNYIDYGVTNPEVLTYGNACTMIKPGYYQEQNYVTGDLENTFLYYMDIDFETWEDIEVATFNGVSVDVGLYANGNSDGRVHAILAGEELENEIAIFPLNTNFAIINIDGVNEYLFDKEYCQELYAHDLRSGSGAEISISENFEVTIGGGSAVQGELSYLPAVGYYLSCGNYSLLPQDDEHNFFVFIDLVTGNGENYYNKDLFDALVGSYTDGSVNVAFNADYLLTIDDVPANYSAVALDNGDGTYSFGLLTTTNILLIKESEDVVSLYIVSGGSITFGKSLVNADKFTEFLGTYCYSGSNGTEHLIFSTENGLQLDTLVEEELVLTSYEHVFGNDEVGNLTLVALIPYGQSTVTLPFVKTDYAYVLDGENNNDLIYVDERLFTLQGMYSDSASNVVMIKENMVFFNSSREEISSITGDYTNGSGTIMINCESGNTILAVVENNVVTQFTITPAAGNPISLNDVTADLFDFEGTKFYEDDNNYLELVVVYSAVNNTVSIQCNKNGSFFSGTVFPVMVDGSVVLQVNSFFGNYRLSIDLEGNAIAIKL